MRTVSIADTGDSYLGGTWLEKGFSFIGRLPAIGVLYNSAANCGPVPFHLLDFAAACSLLEMK